MTTTLPRRVTPAEKVLFQDLERESIMLDLESEYYFSLDDVGTRMWQLLNAHEETATVLARGCSKSTTWTKRRCVTTSPR